MQFCEHPADGSTSTAINVVAGCWHPPWAADSSTVDFTYCRLVLQKRWRVRCNHGGGVSATRASPELPPHDPHDAVQAILVANAISSAD